MALISGTTKYSVNVDKVRERLEQHGMLVEKNNLKNLPILNNEVDHIVGPEQHSSMSKESAEQFIEKAKENATVDEQTTFQRSLWPLILGNSRTVLMNGILIPQDWECESELAVASNQLFNPGAAPRFEIRPGNKIDELEAKLIGRIRTPKPDYVFGLQKKVFTSDRRVAAHALEENAFAEVVSRVWFAFFIVEFKGTSACIQEAENQACRGGATLVKIKMEQEALANGSPPILPDYKNIAFSLCMTAKCADLYVHWAGKHQDNPSPQYHMEYVRHYAFREEVDVIKLRRDIHNVIDWGLHQRKDEVFSMLDKVVMKTNAGTFQMAQNKTSSHPPESSTSASSNKKTPAAQSPAKSSPNPGEPSTPLRRSARNK